MAGLLRQPSHQVVTVPPVVVDGMFPLLVNSVLSIPVDMVPQVPAEVAAPETDAGLTENTSLAPRTPASNVNFSVCQMTRLNRTLESILKNTTIFPWKHLVMMSQSL